MKKHYREQEELDTDKMKLPSSTDVAAPQILQPDFNT